MPAIRYGVYDSVEIDNTIKPLEFRPGVSPHFAAMYLWYIISISFMYINNSINFYLYCLGGATFRDEFYTMMTCCCCWDCSTSDVSEDEMESDPQPEIAGATDRRSEEGNAIELVFIADDNEIRVT